MNFEELLSELGQDLQNMPGEMDKAGMQKNMTRRRTIHRISVVGRTAACLLATMFMVLFVGVNTSVKFARAATNVPVIGSLSEAIIVRKEVRDALTDHQDLEKPISEGELIEVSIVVPGQNSSTELTLDSIMVDEHGVTAFIKVITETQAKGFYTIQNPKFVDLDTGEEIEVVLDNQIFEESGEIYLNRFYWGKVHTSFSIDFDFVDEKTDFTSWRVVESYHFEFRNVKFTETRHVPIDQTVSFEGHECRFVELQIAPSGTKIILEPPIDNTIDFAFFTITIEDEDGNTIAEQLPNSTAEYQITTEDGKTYFVALYSTIYYEDVSKICLHIKDYYCAFFEEDVMTIDTQEKTGTFNGQSFPVQVINGKVRAGKLGIPEEYVSYYEWLESSRTTLLVPVLEGMPDFNSQIFTTGRVPAYNYEYPKATVDGQEYFVMQLPNYDIEDDGKCYFVHGYDYDTYIFQQYIDITI